jgi:hypothetical protein
MSTADPLQVAVAASARETLRTFITEAGRTTSEYGWACWAGTLAETLRSVLATIPQPPPDLDPGLCNWPLDGGLCVRPAGHHGDCRPATCGPGLCTCGATVDHDGIVHAAVTR